MYGQKEIANFLIFQLRLSVSRVCPSQYFSRIPTICSRCDEASCCGCPVIASDRAGAAKDLIAPMNPSFIYPYGAVDALAELLEVALANPVLLAKRGRAARMEAYRFEKISPGP